MKKFCFLAVLIQIAVLSCSRSRGELSSLDRAIEMQPYYDGLHQEKQDSLRNLYHLADTDSARWEAAYKLEKIFYYHNVDSCNHYIQEMLRLQENDPRRRTVSLSCKANVLFKLDSLAEASRVLEQIDTSLLDSESLPTYCFAGHHIYKRLARTLPELEEKRAELIDLWWVHDSTNVECAYYKNQDLRESGEHEKALARLRACRTTTPNDTAKLNYYIAKEYLNMNEKGKALRHLAISAEYDMRVSAKAYNALYELALMLFRSGDIQRADRYMRITLEDAQKSNYAMHYQDIINAEFEIMNALLRQEAQKGWAYFITILATALLLMVALVSLVLLSGYSARLDRSSRQLQEVSDIKDGFLANYMEKCVDYLNKVDEYRSSLRHTLKQDGADAVRAMLRKPSFSTEEFSDLLTSFDSTFLGIFPEFVDKVNEHMQPEYKLTMPAKGTLSTELRILALIKLGISKRPKIAKILNMSVTTVYSYHCNLQKHSLHPDASFDVMIASL